MRSILAVAFVVVCGCSDAKDPDASEGEQHATVASLREHACPPNAQFVCSDKALWSDREAQLFGTENHPVDKDGCMKVACRSPQDCAAGWECYQPSCYPLNVSCQDTPSEVDGRVQCECAADPACGGAFCRPK
jgi:hypothetical protein